MKATREEMKAEALRLMERIYLGDDFIEELRENDEVGMTEQYIRPREDAKARPGDYQKRTYFGLAGEMYSVYPYIAGLRECDEAPAKFEQKTGYFVWHMNYTEMSIGRMLTLFYISNRDERYDEDNEEYDIKDYWKEVAEAAVRGGTLSAYCVNLDDEAYSEYGELPFCTTDNGCLMRLA
jgi:hypothetical protein